MDLSNLSEPTRGFFARERQLDLGKYIRLKYFFITDSDPVEAAGHLAQEQSTAQFRRVGVDEDYRHEFGAKVISLRRAQADDLLCGDRGGLTSEESRRARIVEIALPTGNFGDGIPNLMTAICGEGAFHSPGIRKLKLLDIDFPDSYLEAFDGPRFGISGIRDSLGVFDRPLMLGVVKPNIGLPPEPFGELAYQAWLGGLDIAKDDELLCDTPWSPFHERSKLLGQQRLRAEDATGVKKMYLANITDEVDRMPELYDTARKHHVNGVMVNGMTTGLSAVRMLSKKAEIPLFSHFDFIAPYTQEPTFGIHLQVVMKLHRLAGFDCVIYQGLGERMGTSGEEVLLAFRACTAPMGRLRPSLPVPGGSQWAGSFGELFPLFDSTDFGIVPGRAVFSHPMGPTAGAKALMQGWESARDGTDIQTYAENHEELRSALSM